MTPTPSNKATELLNRLDRLERSLDLPLVPGELSRWVTEVEEEFGAAEHAFRKQIQSRHAEQFDQIAKDDPELLGRVEEMQRTDQTNTELCNEFQAELTRLRRLADVVGPDEKRAEETLQNVVNQGLQFVVEARKQETVLETWLLEAFDRDRGDAD